MHRNLLIPTLLATLIISSPAPLAAQVPAVTDSAMAYLKTLSDPARFQGRKSGVEKGNESQTWIAAQFERWGLEPLIDDQLLHRFPMLTTVEKKAELELLDTERYGDLEFLLGDDYALTVNSGSGNVTAPVTIVGHGISKPEKEWDDYGEIDVEGRIVVILRGKPNREFEWDEEYSRTYLLNEAKAHGAAAVLFYMGENVTGGAAIMQEAYDPELPSAIIGKRVLDHLFWGTGYTLDVYQRVLNQMGPKPLHLNKRMRIKAKVKRLEDAFGYNVAGVIPGTDPELQTEAVILGGHGDHVGTNALGLVYPGADDNGSGTSVVMELARVFAQNPQPRTMIFMVFGAEEQGLLGSKAIVPDLPEKYNYVTMVNLDMSGRGDGITGIGGGQQWPEVWFDWYSNLPDSTQKSIDGRRAWGGNSSDHAPFRNNGIPSFTTYSRGSHDYYHSTDDRYYTIDTRAIGGALDALGRWLQELASYPEPLAADPGSRAARAIWHQGYGFKAVEITSTIDKTLSKLQENFRDGYIWQTVMLAPPSNPFDTQFLAQLDNYRDRIEQNKLLALGSELKDFRRNAYGLSSTVHIAIPGDSLENADTLAFETWSEFGVSWLKLDNPDLWVSGDSIRADKTSLVDVMREHGTIIQLPLHYAHRWQPLASDLGNSLYVGNWSDFTGLGDLTLEALDEVGGKIVVILDESELRAASENTEKLYRYKVHLQPLSDYPSTLNWISAAKAAGIKDDTLNEWVGENSGRW